MIPNKQQFSNIMTSHVDYSNSDEVTFQDIIWMINNKEIIESEMRKLTIQNSEHDTYKSSVSHDLKSPLNNIEGLLTLVQDSDDMEEIKSYLEMISHSVAQIRKTIKEITDPKDNSLAAAEKVNVEVIIEDVRESIDSLLQQANTRIETDFEVLELNFSSKGLRSVILNLLSNAVKYKSPTRDLEIQITTKKLKNTIVLSVQDNGIGIKDEHIEELFKKFSRVHDNVEDIEGTGLGLFLIKKMVNEAGGTIEVESRIGVGSCFSVHFEA